MMHFMNEINYQIVIITQGSHRSGKGQKEIYSLRVRTISGNFSVNQEILEFYQK